MSKNIDVGTRLKNAREYLNLSTKYIGSLLGLNETAILEIENGEKNISHTEIELFSEIYGWDTNDFLYENKSDNEVVFARTTKDLTNKDNNEIRNLFKLKRKLRKNVSESI